MQPENAKEFDDDNDDFTSSSSYSYDRTDNDKLDDTKPVKEQLQKLMKTMLYKMHSSAAEFYSRDYGNDYKDIITEKVKTNRFGD